MPQKRLSRERCAEIIDAIRTHGNLSAAARALSVPRSTLENVMNAAVSQYGMTDPRHEPNAQARPYDPDNTPECGLTETVTAPDAVALCFGDAHWTTLDQPRSVAHEAMLAVLHDVRPSHLIAMGDLLDMGDPSRHSPLMWGKRPSVRSELEAGKRHLSDIVARAPHAARYWVRGNHDDRFDKWLAQFAGSYDGIEGLALEDHFTDWRMSWVLRFNEAFITHRYHGGIHAGWNNAVKAGVTTVTGDTHSLNVTPMVDQRGRRWGVQCGMLGDPAWPAFHYMLGNTRLWTPGFVVLTWRNGTMLPPETCEVVDGVAWFRGQALAGKPRVRVKAGKAA